MFNPKIAAKIITKIIWIKIFDIENKVFIKAFVVFFKKRISSRIAIGLKHLIDFPIAIQVESGIYIKILFYNLYYR